MTELTEEQTTALRDNLTKQTIAAISSDSVSPADSVAPTLAYHLESENDELRKVIREMRATLMELYALRGEDALIAGVCSPLIESTRGY